MKTFEIKNGDLVVGPGGFTMLSGARKVKQDLAISVLEPYGSDRFHPRWGSLLHTYVGRPADQETQMLVVSEVNRLVANYIAVQQDQMVAARAQGQRQRYGTGEVVGELVDVQVRATMDRLYLRVVLTTLSQETVTLTSSLGL